MSPEARFALCVYCSSSERSDPRNIALAHEGGAEIGRRGWTLVSGGGSVSMMGAVARSVRAEGGHTLGVIPRALASVEVADHEADELVVTDTMRVRKAVMDERSDGFLALPGGLGTLEELLEVWVARSLGMHSKPVVVLDPDGLFDPLREQVRRLVELGFTRPEAAGTVGWARTVPAAFALLGDAESFPG